MPNKINFTERELRNIRVALENYILENENNLDPSEVQQLVELLSKIKNNL